MSFSHDGISYQKLAIFLARHVSKLETCCWQFSRYFLPSFLVNIRERDMYTAHCQLLRNSQSDTTGGTCYYSNLVIHCTHHQNTFLETLMPITAEGGKKAPAGAKTVDVSHGT